MLNFEALLWAPKLTDQFPLNNLTLIVARKLHVKCQVILVATFTEEDFLSFPI